MKKWMYVIFPGLMLVGFLVVYVAHEKEAKLKEERQLKALADKQAEDARKKKESEELAAADAAKRQAEREAEAKKKEDERAAKQAAIDKGVADETAKAKSDADASAKKAAQLEIELDKLRKEKDQLQKADFELARRVEAARVAKRTMELREQHMMRMIAERADQSHMAQMPALPPPPKR